MGENSAIEWTTHSFNTHWGCTAVSPGCDHCYAEKFARRRGVKWGVGQERRTFGDRHWDELRKWNDKARRARHKADLRLEPDGRLVSPGHERPRVFVNSMSDTFDKDAPPGVRERLWQLAEGLTELDLLLLTKRVGNVAKMVPERWMREGFPPNVWLGISLVDQAERDRDLAKLLALPVRVRFVSLEPLLGNIDLRLTMSAALWTITDPSERRAIERTDAGRNLHWVIVGGESGPGARPFDIAWARSIVAQCKAAGVACFVKQLGAHVITDGIAGPSEGWPSETYLFDTRLGHFRKRLIDRKGGDWDEWPPDLRVREFPRAAA